MRYRWFDSVKGKTDEFGVPLARQPVEPTRKTKPTRGEMTGIGVAIVVLLYGVATDDLPLIFLAVSFIAFELRPLVETMGGAHGQAISNFLQSFSIALFFGTLVWICL